MTLTYYKNLIINIFLHKLDEGEFENLSEADIKAFIENLIDQEVNLIDLHEKRELFTQVCDSLFGLGRIEVLLKDEMISEIMVNGKDNVYFEKKGQLYKSDIQFSSDDELMNLINVIVSKAGRRIDQSSPMVDARLPDKSRVNAIISPLSLLGPVLTIRKFPKEVFELENFVKNHTLTSEMANVLSQCVQNKWNIVVSGGTGSGKTTLLNCLSNLINSSERIITIEDSAEMRIKNPHIISLETRPANSEGTGEVTIRQILRNALRMRPDRIIVGEIRSGEAIDMLQAMNTGHKGSLTTVHANSPLESMYRIETMALMSDLDLPLSALRPQIISAIDLIIQMKRIAGGARKMVEISQVYKADLHLTDYELKKWFFYDSKTDSFIKTNNVPLEINSFN